MNETMKLEENSMNKNKKLGFLSWSGNLSRRILEFIKDHILEDLFRDHIETFFSQQIGTGIIFDKEIFEKLTKSDFGIVCVTAENIEKPWLLFECGSIMGKMGNNKLHAIAVDVPMEMLQRLNDPLARLQTAQLNKDGFANLTRQICNDVGMDSAGFVLKLHEKWDSYEKELKEIVNTNKPHPDTYYKQVKYVNSIDDWNLKMPSIFSFYTQEVFLAGLNHSFLLNLKNTDSRDNFLTMINSLLADPDKKVRIMISDIWDEKVISSYEELIQKLAVESVTNDIKDVLSNKDSEHYLEKVIIRNMGEEKLKRIKERRQLEIKTIKMVGDTFVFIDKMNEGGLCYFSLLSSPGGQLRPVFTFNRKDDVFVFNVYSSFIEQGWNSMSELVWPK